MALLTVAYVTFRRSPRFQWFASSLERELRETLKSQYPFEFDRSQLQVLVIDGRRDERLFSAPFPIEHHAPKPTVWQGQHRLTKNEYFCAANTRNTAFALARGKQIAFVDDLSVLLPGWLAAHLHAARNCYVLASTTCKVKNLIVSEDGTVVGSVAHPPGVDSRMSKLPAGGEPMGCPGGWLYGGSFSVPMDYALAVNGQDEICDTIGGEDYDFGIRLERAGAPMYISRHGTLEDEDAHHTEAPMIRLDKPWPPVGGVPRTALPGGWSAPAEPNAADGPFSSNYLYNSLIRSSRTWTIGNAFDLRELRETILAGGEFPVPKEPKTHWVDGQSLETM